MKSLLIVGALGALAACAPSTTTTTSSLLAEVQSVCAEAFPIASLVPAVGVYATAFCAADNLAATTLTPADLAWISNILGELKGNVSPVLASSIPGMSVPAGSR